MTEQEEKRMFGLALVENPTNAFTIALRLFPRPEDTGKALDIATNWPLDPEVMQIMADALAEPDEAGLLKSKHQFAHMILLRAERETDNEVFCKLGELYAKVMGQIDKPGANAPVTVVNKVIIMPAQLQKDEFSLRATKQQELLMIEGERVGKR